MANGWTEERRARQAELIRTWKPWKQSTGPRSEAGKMRSSQNAYVHGGCSTEVRQEAKRVNDFLRQCREILRLAALG